MSRNNRNFLLVSDVGIFEHRICYWNFITIDIEPCEDEKSVSVLSKHVCECGQCQAHFEWRILRTNIDKGKIGERFNYPSKSPSCKIENHAQLSLRVAFSFLHDRSSLVRRENLNAKILLINKKWKLLNDMEEEYSLLHAYFINLQHLEHIRLLTFLRASTLAFEEFPFPCTPFCCYFNHTCVVSYGDV